MKVLMIDPWGINNISMYTNGLCNELAKITNVTLITNYYFKKTGDSNYQVNYLFFKYSEKKKINFIRKIIRSIEYVITYINILNLLKKNKFDIVHIQWLLLYKVDLFFIKKFKKHCKKLVYTAHNVRPHINGEKNTKTLEKIYNFFDRIYVHGEKIKLEISNNFKLNQNKINIQRHGKYFNDDISYNTDIVSKKIKTKIDEFNSIFIFFGHMFYNKGVDRLVKIWKDIESNKSTLLIIAGKKNKKYNELTLLEPLIYSMKNVLYINSFLNNNLLNFLISKSNLIIMPYRKASMSGIIFTAANFSKPILSTRVGAISEYISHNQDGFLVKNNDDELRKKIIDIMDNYSNNQLDKLGNKLRENITNNFDWFKIAFELKKNYQSLLNHK